MLDKPIHASSAPDSAIQPVPKNLLFNLPLQTWVFILIGVFLSVLVLKSLYSILQPLFIAAFLCYFMIPLRRGLHLCKIPNILIPFLSALIVILVSGLFIWITTTNFNTLKNEKLPIYQEKFLIQSTTLINNFKHYPQLEKTLDWAQKHWQSSASKENAINGMVGTFFDTALGVFSFLGTLFLVGVYMIFLFLEARTLPQRLTLAYGREKSTEILVLLEKINQGIVRYIWVKTIVSLLVAFLCTVIMLVFQVDLWLFWGMVIFFANFIPYIGPTLATIPPVLILFVQIGSPILTALVFSGLLLVFLTIAHNIVGSFLEPKLAGKALNLSPLLVIVSLAFWGWLWGIVGMVLAVPILVVIKTTLEFIPPTQSFARLLGDCG